ncbi:MAG TPA: hypothetical protein VFV73_34440 [Streptosporangiaceae bacterium]|nr:hypothetical protein [Streptosporangiaceae bacterium]
MPDFPATILAAATPERNTFTRNCVAEFPAVISAGEKLINYVALKNRRSSLVSAPLQRRAASSVHVPMACRPAHGRHDGGCRRSGPGGTRQLWQPDSVSGIICKFQNIGTGRCLEARNGAVNGGAGSSSSAYRPAS